MDQNMKIQLGLLDEKVQRMAMMGLSKEEFISSFSKAEVGLIEKSKYIRREGIPGDYKYIYEEPKPNKRGNFEDPNMATNFIAARFRDAGVNSKDFEVSGDGELFAIQNKKTGDLLHFKFESRELDKVNNWLKKQKEGSKDKNKSIVLKEGLTFSIGEQSGGGEVTARIIKIDGDKYTIETFTKEENKGKHTFGEDDIRDLIEEGGYKIKESGEKNASEKRSVGDTIRMKDDVGLISLSGLKGKELKIKDIKEVNFASGAQKYFVVEDKWGDDVELPERFVKSIDSTITKSEDSKEQKVARVMKEFKEGKLKSSSGEVVTDHKQAIAIAMSEAGISKSVDNDSDDVEKGGEGSRGGKVIGHTKSGKPIYDNFEHEGHSKFTKKDHKDAAKIHENKINEYGDRLAKYQRERNETGVEHSSYHADKHEELRSKHYKATL